MAEDRLAQIHSDQGKFSGYFTVFFVVMNLVIFFGNRADLLIVSAPALLAIVAGSVAFYRKMWQIEKDSSVKTVKYELAAIAFVSAAIGLALAISLLLFLLV